MPDPYTLFAPFAEAARRAGDRPNGTKVQRRAFDQAEAWVAADAPTGGT